MCAVFDRMSQKIDAEVASGETTPQHAARRRQLAVQDLCEAKDILSLVAELI
jgi:hypothetical protein